MLCHKTSLINLKRLKSHLFQPPSCKTRSQLQEENWKIHKYVKIKKHVLEQPISQRRNFKKRPWKNENGNTKCQNIWDTSKAVLRGKV